MFFCICRRGSSGGHAVHLAAQSIQKIGHGLPLRSARKHIAWYLRALPGGEAFRQHINTIEDSAAQWQAVADFLDALGSQMDRMPAATAALADTEEQEGLPA